MAETPIVDQSEIKALLKAKLKAKVKSKKPKIQTQVRALGVALNLETVDLAALNLQSVKS
jgi:hypothetical protein